VEDFAVEYSDGFESYNTQAVCDFVWKKIGELDEKITVTEPFKLVKTDKEKAIVLIEELVREVYNIGRMLAPIMPEANRVIKEAVLANKKPENLFNRLGA
jgi:methionyl-tRNA synthetase